MNQRKTPNRFVFGVKKFFFSAFVVLSFIAYALENRGSAATNGTPISDAAVPTQTGAAASAAANPASVAPSAAAAVPTTGTSATSATTSSGYKDGTYTGPVVNVNWGYVQVQTTIQSGKISYVQFLQYPNERNTSVRINSFAVPQLQQEAIQAQSANVDIVTGATLTSEGFQQSLQAALNQAKG